ncbi:hypothetical protein P280DRAFT_466602 [Massarina eburnea CBS 473.64]|uniref:Homeobox domain-containing protein n=1 Tax=Massarina eburnea CBS 473.64 TaxID=1395130 RepID=A0A6A6S7N4_9PLEO|nr:hypothetical protein P280DRAFT_466602 [Massarina eburnea CBS 473.64]
MSDSTTPTSSPKSSSSPNYSFLVHSPSTVANALPPEIQPADRPLARQKRRRTSKEDEEVLVDAYRRNPKPDKAARIEIEAKVALGAREIQIWFQNRRQNDRRRSRPLDSSILMSSSSLMSDPPAEDETKALDVEERVELEQEAAEERAEAADPPAVDSAAESTDSTKATTEDAPTEEAAAPGVDSQDAVALNAIPSTDAQAADTADAVPTEEVSSQQTLSSSQGASQPRTSWISNRRSASFVRNSEDYAPEFITFPSSSQTAPQPMPQPMPQPTPQVTPAPELTPSATKSLKRKHSFVRISTNEDGTARIVTDLDKSPSPTHPRTSQSSFSRAAAGLRRSYSAVGLNERLVAAAEGRSPKLPRTSSNVGRSRDSRAWEFWCDPDSRHNTSLTARAEQEGSGSAADAIGLLRANRRILSQNQARQNTPVISRAQSGKMSSENGVRKPRGPMQRASTTYGRLQSKANRKGSNSSESDELPQTESDKENWEPQHPQSRRSKHSGHPLGSQRPRQVLGENTEIMSQSQSLGAMMDREKGTTPRKAGRKGSNPEEDEELRSFMSGNGDGSGRTTVSSAEEAGCVEGLLKLSQGQWR